MNKDSVFYNNIGTDRFKQGLDDIKEELEDHLNAINENTNEIQANYEYIAKLDLKIDKLAEQIEKIQIFLQKNSTFKAKKTNKFNIQPLTKKEQEIFLILYTLEERKSITHKEIARKALLTEALVRDCITSMMEKGVPIIKKYFNNKSYLRLDSDFKSLQAKENILKIEQTVIKNFNQ